MNTNCKAIVLIAVALALVSVAAISESDADAGGDGVSDYVAYIDDQGYETLQEAVNGANDGDTIEIVKDVEVNKLVIEESVSLVGIGEITITTEATDTESGTIMEMVAMFL